MSVTLHIMIIHYVFSLFFQFLLISLSFYLFLCVVPSNSRQCNLLLYLITSRFFPTFSFSSSHNCPRSSTNTLPETQHIMTESSFRSSHRCEDFDCGQWLVSDAAQSCGFGQKKISCPLGPLSRVKHLVRTPDLSDFRSFLFQLFRLNQITPPS